MVRSRQCILAAVAAALGVSAAAQAADPQIEQLQAQVRELQAQVQALQTSRSSATDQANATIQQVLKDAEQRNNLLAEKLDMWAGWDNGFVIRAGDAFSFSPRILFHLRNVTNWRDDNAGGSDDFKNGFELRRARFLFVGNAFVPDLTYLFEYEAGRNANSVYALEAWLQYRIDPALAIRAGQIKLPLAHEELMGSGMLLAADRSILNDRLGGGFYDYGQGVSLTYGGFADDQPLRAAVAWTDGFNTRNTDFQNNIATAVPGVTVHSDFSLSGRVEYKFSGAWKDYNDFTARETKSNLLVAGAAGGFDQRDNRDVWLGTLDAQWESANGLSLYAAAIANYHRLRNTGGEDTRLDWGGMLQTAYAFNPKWEVFGRWSFVRTDSDFVAAGFDKWQHELTVGVNHYLFEKWGHRAKITVDLNYLPNGAPADETGLGILQATGSEFVLRAQFQLAL